MPDFKPGRRFSVMKIGRASTFAGSGQILERMAGYLLREEEDVLVNYKGFKGGPDLLAAMHKGDVDIGNVWSSFVFSAITQGENVKAIAKGSWGASEFVMVARKDIETSGDLKGKRIAHHGFRSLTETCVELILNKIGLTHADVNVVMIPGTDKRVAALLAGQIDATLLWSERAYGLVREHPDFRIVGSMADYFPTIDGYYFFAAEDFLEKNSDITYLCVKYIVKSARRLYKMTSEEIADFALREYIPSQYECNPQDLSATFRHYMSNREWDENGGLTNESFHSTASFFLRNGIIEKPISFQRACDRSALDDVLEELGRI